LLLPKETRYIIFALPATTKQRVNVSKLKFVILWAITLLCRKQLILKLRVRHATDEVQRRLAGINLSRGGGAEGIVTREPIA
jgi:hypothetical protein